MRTARTVLVLHTIVAVTRETLASTDALRSMDHSNNTQRAQPNLELHLDGAMVRFSKDFTSANDIAPILMLLVGLKVAGFIMAAVSFVAFLVLNAFLASKLAVLIAIALALKKWNATFESFHENLHLNHKEVNDRWYDRDFE